MRFENTEIWGFKHAFRGMRNPLESWNKSNSDFRYGEHTNYQYSDFLCENDLELAKRLIKAGTEHRKFLRQIFVSVDITAPLYWWKEFDTYKIGTTANSTSTMHKIQSNPITLDCFEIDDYEPSLLHWCPFDDEDYKIDLSDFVTDHIKTLEGLRKKYVKTKDKRYWKELIRWLPSGWLQTRTVTMTYENVISMYNQRKNHKLTEWSDSFCEWCESLPYFKEMFIDD